jgi:hypothetical protein
MGMPGPQTVSVRTATRQEDDGSVSAPDARQSHHVAEPPLSAPEPVVLGIPCPVCGTLLDSVLFTRRAMNQILRVRKCNKCRRRVRTSERIVATNSPGRGENPQPPTAP